MEDSREVEDAIPEAASSSAGTAQAEGNPATPENSQPRMYRRTGNVRSAGPQPEDAALAARTSRMMADAMEMIAMTERMNREMAAMPPAAARVGLGRTPSTGPLCLCYNCMGSRLEHLICPEDQMTCRCPTCESCQGMRCNCYACVEESLAHLCVDYRIETNVDRAKWWIRNTALEGGPCTLCSLHMRQCAECAAGVETSDEVRCGCFVFAMPCPRCPERAITRMAARLPPPEAYGGRLPPEERPRSTRHCFVNFMPDIP